MSRKPAARPATTLGGRIQHAMNQRGLDDLGLGEAVRLSDQSIRRYRTDQRVPRSEGLERRAAAPDTTALEGERARLREHLQQVVLELTHPETAHEAKELLRALTRDLEGRIRHAGAQIDHLAARQPEFSDTEAEEVKRLADALVEGGQWESLPGRAKRLVVRACVEVALVRCLPAAGRIAWSREVEVRLKGWVRLR